MDKLSAQQRHAKAAIKQEQSDAGISSAEREQARRSANMAAIRSKDTKPEIPTALRAASMRLRRTSRRDSALRTASSCFTTIR